MNREDTVILTNPNSTTNTFVIYYALKTKDQQKRENENFE